MEFLNARFYFQDQHVIVARNHVDIGSYLAIIVAKLVQGVASYY